MVEPFLWGAEAWHHVSSNLILRSGNWFLLFQLLVAPKEKL